MFYKNIILAYSWASGAKTGLASRLGRRLSPPNPTIGPKLGKAKFAAPGTAIAVQITKKDGKAHTTIRNLGGTIPPEEIPLLFERFHKADYSRSMDREGVGLGLYIVKTILGNLKENITVTSEDGVTQFHFTLTLA